MAKRATGISTEELYKKYPVLRGILGPASEEAWEGLFATSPESIERILADLIKQEYAPKGRVGQRPMPREEDVNLRKFLRDEYTDLPLHEVLPKIISTSQRNFARRINMSKTQFRRVLSGELVPDPSQIRRIAEALDVSPFYFLEYRRMVLASALLNLFEKEPQVLNTLCLKYVEVRLGKGVT